MTTYIGYKDFSGKITCECGEILDIAGYQAEAVCVCGRKYIAECMKELSEYESPLSITISEIPNCLEQILNIPQQNFLHADRYDTDDEHTIHLWNDGGESFDIRVPKRR
jgi:hypothetical protein